MSDSTPGSTAPGAQVHTPIGEVVGQPQPNGRAHPALGIRGQAAAARAAAENGEAEESSPPQTGRHPNGQFQSNQSRPQAEEAKPQSAMSEAAKEAVRRHKLRVDGREIEVDEDELKRGYGHTQAAAKKMQQAQLATKRAEMALEMMQDPNKFWEIAKKLGHDPRRLSEMQLTQALEEELLTPEERDQRDLKARLKHYEELETRQKEAETARMQEAATKKYREKYEVDFVEALKTTDIEPTPETVGRMAHYIELSARLAKAQGKEHLITVQEAAELVKQDNMNLLRRYAGRLEGESLVKFLGEEVANRVRKYDTSKLKDPNRYASTPQQATEHRPRAETQTRGKRMTPREWQLHKRGLK